MPDDQGALTAGIDPDSVHWRRPTGMGGGESEGEGVMEVAIVSRTEGGNWVLLRVAGDPAGLVLAYDEYEWACFLDGVRNGEFDLPG
jgi:hypothetical protein